MSTNKKPMHTGTNSPSIPVVHRPVESKQELLIGRQTQKIDENLQSIQAKSAQDGSSGTGPRKTK